MEYSKLNKAIFNYWKSQSVGSDYFLFVYDEDRHQEFLSKLDISEKQYFECVSSFGQSSWSNYLKDDIGLPSVFGIISLQLLAATRMTGRNINSKICEYLNCQHHELQQNYATAQEDIWAKAQKYIENSGFKLELPEPRKYTGRYIQYPLSQSYLRIADLRNILRYLVQKTKDVILDELRFKDFVHTTNLDRPYNIPKRYKTPLFEDILKKGQVSKKIMLHQIFNYFISHQETEDFNDLKKRQKKLFFDYEDGFFSFFDNKKESINPGQLTEFTRDKSNILFLREDPQWGDFHQVQRLDLEQEYKLILLTAPILTKYRSIPFEMSHGIYMADITIDALNKGLFSEYLSRQKPQLEISGGLKVNRSTYLYEFGPTLYLRNNCKFIDINGERKYVSKSILDLSGLETGEYTIQVNNEVSRNLSIVKAPDEIKPAEEGFGWNLGDLSIGGDDVIGQWFKNIVPKLTPALFMEYHRRNARSTIKSSPSNIVLRNIKRQNR